jgi:hypothetical protein
MRSRLHLLLIYFLIQSFQRMEPVIPARAFLDLRKIAKSLSDRSSCIGGTPTFGVVPPFLWCAI